MQTEYFSENVVGTGPPISAGSTDLFLAALGP